MKLKINKTFIIALIIVFTTATMPYIANAKNEETESVDATDPDDDNDVDEYDPPPPPDDEDPDAPLDGGVSILIASGIGYGVKKIYESRRKIKEITGD
jgi:hypothetical protein